MWVLTAFNTEVARTAEAVTDSLTGAIRLKWWLEVLEAIEKGEKPRKHPVVEALNTVITYYQLPIEPLKKVIEARERDISEGMLAIPDVASLDLYAEQTGSGVWLPLTGLIKNTDERKAVQYYLLHAGQLWALIGLLRSTGHHLASGRCYIPKTVLQEHGLNEESLLQHESYEIVCHIISAMAARLVPNMQMVEDAGGVLAKHYKRLAFISLVLGHQLKGLQKSPHHVLKRVNVSQHIDIQIKMLLAHFS